jgi:hypothetical protein
LFKLPIDKLLGLCYNGNERPERLWRARRKSKRKKPSFLGLVVRRVARIFGIGFPNATAVVGFLSKQLARTGEVGSNDLELGTRQHIFDFVEVVSVFHSLYLLFFCTLIIAHERGFVNPFYSFPSK